MKRKQDKDLDKLSEIYRSNPAPSKDIDWDAYERKVREQDEKFGKFDEVGNPNRYKGKSIDSTILEWKAEIMKIEDKYRGKPTKSWDGTDLGILELD